MYSGEYVPPTLTVDSVIFQIHDSQLEVLLIQRTQQPFAGSWALPGGYVAAGETTRQALERVLGSKAGLRYGDIGLVEQLYAFDTVARDPRGHAVSITYMGLGRELQPQADAGVQNPRFIALDNLPDLAYDHSDIVEFARQRLQSQLERTTAIAALLPPEFTLSQLQSAYEAVLDHELDKRNFRKKFLSLDVIEETGAMQKHGAHRPARLYRFRQSEPQSLMRSFE